MNHKRLKRKSGPRQNHYTFKAFLLALLAFFGISLGNKFLSGDAYNFTGTQNSETVVNSAAKEGNSSADTFLVHILGVDQGLAVFVEAGEDTLLYDGGGADTSSFVVSYLQKQGLENLDYCIASHYDADHLSGIVGALHKFECETLLAPDYSYDTKTYSSFLNVAEEKSLTVHHPIPGESYPFGDGLITILAPQGTGYEDENDYSIVIKISLGESSLLLTGDATTVSEAEMLDSHMDLDSDVLVLGHHGGYNSTGKDFFNAVSPEYAIISCGRSNEYGHPHTRIMKLLEERNSTLYRTDLQGTICFTMTAEKIVFDTPSCQNYATGDEVRYQNDTAK